MRVFVTGATGFIGSATVRELLAAGHQVTGLARSDEAAAALAAAGAEVHRGDLHDLDSLRAGAAGAVGVIHTAFVHDFARLESSGHTDLHAVEAMGGVLEGSGRPLVIASGTALVVPGRLATERDASDPASPGSHRVPSERAALALAERGVRSAIVRFPPSVHGEGDHGFVGALIAVARDRGVSGYVGDGANRWAAVHRLDAARLVRLAAEAAPAGSVLHGVGEEGVPAREIAEAIGRGLGVPVVSVAAGEAGEHFGWLGRFFAADVPASSALTRERLGWTPAHQGLIADLEQGHYVDVLGDRARERLGDDEVGRHLDGRRQAVGRELHLHRRRGADARAAGAARARPRPAPGGAQRPRAAGRRRDARRPRSARGDPGGPRADRDRHATGGGMPSAVAASSDSQPHVVHACRKAERANSSAAACGSPVARASSHSSR